MNILFIHQNMPGQFRHLAPNLASRGHRVVFITKRDDRKLPGVQHVAYKPQREPTDKIHHYLRNAEDAVLHGQEVLRVCMALKQAGFVPDLIVGHPGWGETLFVKDCFETTPVIAYAEFYFRPDQPLAWFDKTREHQIDEVCKMRMANAHLMVALENADLVWSPTKWQASQFPDMFAPRMRIVPDGIDTVYVQPKPDASLTLADGRVLTRADEVITYAARNLEPMRGFPQFVRALPAILAARPNAHVVINGGDEVSYGIGKGKVWREEMLAEVPLPSDRVHVIGYVPYSQYVSLLQISSVHVYLTYPFVLSWSFFEAMAAGCLIVASDTAPVREVLRDGENGLMTDFWDSAKIARDVVVALDDPRRDALRAGARRSVVEGYGIDVGLAAQRDLLAEAAGKPL